MLVDRVYETTTTSGTGTFTLAGAITGYQTFLDGVGEGNTCYYCCACTKQSGCWEVGIGTVSGSTLSRDTVLASSNSDALVDFDSGTKNVFVTFPANKAVYENASGNASVSGDLAVGGNIEANGIAINGSVSAGYPLTIYQSADNQGVYLYGYDDQSSSYLTQYITGGGSVVQASGGSMGLYPGASSTLYLHSNSTTGSVSIFSGTTANPTMFIYGYDSALGAAQWGGHQVDANGHYRIVAEEQLYLASGGNVGTNGILLRSNGDLWLFHDNQQLQFGAAADDSYIQYDGNNLQFVVEGSFDFKHGSSNTTTVVMSSNAGSNIRTLIQQTNSRFSFIPDTGVDQFVINESGLDVDTRIEGDTDANLIYCDGGLDSVGIGMVPTGAAKLEVAEFADSKGLRIYGYDDMSAQYVQMYVAGSGSGNIQSTSSISIYPADTSGLDIHPNSTTGNVSVFSATNGNPLFYIYGYDSGEATLKKVSHQIAYNGTYRIYGDEGIYIAPGGTLGNAVLFNSTGDVWVFHDNQKIILGADSGDSYLRYTGSQLEIISATQTVLWVGGNASITLQSRAGNPEFVSGTGENIYFSPQGEYIVFDSASTDTTLQIESPSGDGSVRWYDNGTYNAKITYEQTSHNLVINPQSGTSTTGDVHIAAGTLVLDDTVYDDLRVPLTAVQTGGLSDPDWIQIQDDGSGSTGVYTYHFDQNTEEEVFFIVQLPHSWKEGTNIIPHVHWCPTNTNTGSVVWALEYTWADVGDAFGNTSTLTVTDAADGTTNKHQIADLGNIDGTGKTLSSMLICRLYRDAGNGSDTYNADAAALEIDFHYEINTLGSREEYTK